MATAAIELGKNTNSTTRLTVIGLLDEAEKFFTEAKRWDLVNKLLQARGDWKRAVAVAQKDDRIHLRSTYHLFGKYLEGLGDTGNAIKQYEMAETHRFYG